MVISVKMPIRMSVLLACASLLALPAQAQDNERPDLEGIWTNASLTKLSRPSGVETLVVTPEEALVIAANTPIAGLEGR